MWKSLGCIMVNGVPWEVLWLKPSGLRLLRFWPWDFPRDSIHHDTPSAFPHIVPVYSLKCTVYSVHCTAYSVQILYQEILYLEILYLEILCLEILYLKITYLDTLYSEILF